MDLLASAYDDDDEEGEEDTQGGDVHPQVNCKRSPDCELDEGSKKRTKKIDRKTCLEESLLQLSQTSPLFPSVDLEQRRKTAWVWFQRLLLQEFQSEFSSSPEDHVQLFGSWVCNMWVASSDFDVNIFTECRIPKVFLRLKHALLAQEPTSAVDIVASARVPVMKIKARGFNFDVTHEFGNDNLVVKHHAQVREWAQRWAEDESICLCIRIIKLWAGANKVHSATSSTLNSMGYLVMLLSVVGRCTREARASHNTIQEAADQDKMTRAVQKAVIYLGRFFADYATLGVGRHVITAPDSAVQSEGTELDILRLSREVGSSDGTGKGTSLFIQDPFIPEVNLGRFVDRSSLKRLRLALSRADSILNAQEPAPERGGSDSEERWSTVWQQLLTPR
mmetsp:Transcript_4340/g.10247  ORF Transcript_4340/g.10247 Transcript_4340/m.10247 type:complete len:392 (+) Transcript_4340:53-1228(+)